MTAAHVYHYVSSSRWIHYDGGAIFEQLIAARTASGVLSQLPYLSQWIETVHQEQLRLEAAGTSRIEGAEFTPQEESEALAPAAANRTDLTYSQRQLRSAEATYQWIACQAAERPVNWEFVLEVHRRIVTGCDDDHCEPGALRGYDHNVNFGTPRCRGVEGGDECRDAFDALVGAVAGEFQAHDPIIQAMAVHYHVGAMHPFGDGNGRTARAIEAFMLKKAGVNGRVMVSLSNYYHGYKEKYLGALFESRERGHDLTPFLQFALPSVTERCNAVAGEILAHHKRILFKEFARSLFGQLRSPRRRVLAERQLKMLDTLLGSGPVGLRELIANTQANYRELKYGLRAHVRDVAGLIELEAVAFKGDLIQANLEWPEQFSQSELLERYENMPSAVSTNHPAMADLSRLLGRSN